MIAKHDWTPVREAYVTESPRPTYEELATRFNIPAGTVTRVASADGWPDMRQARMLELAQKSDALEILTKAANSNRLISDLAATFAEEMVAALIDWLPTVKNVESPRGRIDMMNTATFAFQNLANGCKGFGVVGLPDSLRKAAGGIQDGLQGNGRWNPNLLVQINTTVEGMKSEAKAAMEAKPGDSE